MSSEVLSIQYDAGAGAIVVKVAAVKESEHVPGTFVRQLGAPEPQARIRLADLPEPHLSSFRDLLEALPKMVETDHAALASDPDEVARKASALAAKEQELTLAEASARESVARAVKVKAALDTEIAAATARKAALEAEIAKAEEAKTTADPSPR